MPILAWLLGAALSASAHDLYPIRPVRATLRVEPDRIAADLRSDSIIWIEEVAGLHPMPANDWPPETLAKVERYVNAHLRLAMDGKPLEGRLVEARYRQFPWEVNEEGTFFLRLVYPPAAGAVITGSARFFEEYRKEVESELAGKPLPYKDEYRTIVTIPGRRSSTFTLTAEAPSFAAPVADARRTALAMTLESFSRGARAAFGAASGFPALLAIALCLGAAAAAPASAAIFLAAAAAGFAAAGFHAPPPWLIWTATLAASLLVGRRAAFAGAAAAAASLGFVWREAAAPLLPHAALAAPAAFAGASAAGAALLAAALAGVRAEHRNLSLISESRVDLLWARRARLAATALAMVGAYGLWQSARR